jgi:hypothetical protein
VGFPIFALLGQDAITVSQIAFVLLLSAVFLALLW